MSAARHRFGSMDWRRAPVERLTIERHPYVANVASRLTRTTGRYRGFRPQLMTRAGRYRTYADNLRRKYARVDVIANPPTVSDHLIRFNIRYNTSRVHHPDLHGPVRQFEDATL